MNMNDKDMEVEPQQPASTPSPAPAPPATPAPATPVEKSVATTTPVEKSVATTTPVEKSVATTTPVEKSVATTTPETGETKVETMTTPVTTTAKVTTTTTVKRIVVDDPSSLNNVLYDLMDLSSYLYLHKPTPERMEQFKHYLGQQHGPIEAYGRLYCRIQTVNIISTISEAITLLSRSSHNYTIIKQMIPKIQEVRVALMRKDANCCNSWNTYNSAPKNKWVLKFRKLFFDNFEALCEDLEIIRHLLCLNEIVNDESSWVHMGNYYDTVKCLPNEHDNTSSIFSKEDLLSLFTFTNNSNSKEVDDTTSTTAAKDEYALKSNTELKQILKTRLHVSPTKHILQPIQNLLLQWDKEALDQPRFVKVGYHIPYEVSAAGSDEDEDGSLNTDDELLQQQCIIAGSEGKRSRTKVVKSNKQRKSGRRITPSKKKTTGGNNNNTPKSKDGSKDEDDDDISSSSSTDTDTISVNNNNDHATLENNTLQSEDITKQLIAATTKKPTRTKQVANKKKSTNTPTPVIRKHTSYTKETNAKLKSNNEVQENLNDLHNRSESLKALSNDPLPEALEAARNAALEAARNASSFTDMLTGTTAAASITDTTKINNKKKRKAPMTLTRLEFEDSGSDDDDDVSVTIQIDESTMTQTSTVQLSELPSTANTQPPMPPKVPKVPVYSNIKATDYNQMKYGKKRNPFNDSEKAAIKQGVDKFGPGQWSSIKSHYAIILRDRNTTQIKDAFRTMKRKGEIIVRPPAP